MKIEERLHDALHEYADSIEPEAGSWSRIAARFGDAPAPHRSSRRPFILGVAVAIVVVLIAGLAVRDDDGNDDAKIVTGPHASVTAMPAHILAVTVAGQPVVLQSDNSLRLSGFGTTSGVAEGTQIAVAPDAKDAYLVQGAGNEGCVGHSLLRLPLDKGVRTGQTLAESATEPTVSPDGRYLAYLHCSPGAGNRPNHIVVRDLATGEERTTSAPAGTFFINRVEFAPDGHRVLYNLFDDAKGRATLYELNVVDGEAPPGRDVGVGAGTSAGTPGWVGIRGQTGEYLVVNGSTPSGVLSVTGFNAPPGTTPPLFTLSGIPNQVVSDESGRHILAIVDHSLYRWSVGDKTPTKIFGNYQGAAWIPDDPQVPPAPAASAALPNGVVVARKGELDVLGASDGQQHSSLGAFPNVTGLGASPDGRELIYASTGPSPACGDQPGPTVSRLDTTKIDTARDAASRFVVGGSGSPAVSPDGEWVGYGVVCDGITPGYTNLHSGANYRFDPLPPLDAKHEINRVEPLAWSPDSKRLLYRLGFKGDPYLHFFIARVSPPKETDTEVVEVPVGPGVTAAAFLDDDTLVLADAPDTETTVRTFDLASKGTKTMFVLAGKVVSLVADRSGRHLLVLRAEGALYRWTQGDHEPVKISDGVTAATWVPWS